jgi:hypothetical protein
VAAGLGLLGHGALVGLFAPSLSPLWLSRQTEAVLTDARLLPRQGMTPSPVAVAGYAEPSLVFALGTETNLGDAEDAAEALAEQRPAVVESREQAAFEKALKARNLKPRLVGTVTGQDYSNGDEMTLGVYAPQETPTP